MMQLIALSANAQTETINCLTVEEKLFLKDELQECETTRRNFQSAKSVFERLQKEKSGHAWFQEPTVIGTGIMGAFFLGLFLGHQSK